MGDVSVHPALLWCVPHAWDGRTCAADLYQKIQTLSRLQVQLLAHQMWIPMQELNLISVTTGEPGELV